MDKVLIVENFHVYVGQGEDQPELRKDFTKGQVIDSADIPEGHTAEAWVEKGHAKAA
jgi:hypothetical protein